MTSKIIGLRKLIRRVVSALGVDPNFASRLARIPRFLSEWRRYQAQNRDEAFRIKIQDLYPVLHDYDAAAGIASGHYFHQDLWAARKIYELRPARHVDIGSRVDGFVAHLLTFMKVDVIDVRPLPFPVSGLRFIQDDATELRQLQDGGCESLSSLNVAEHFGLGRYGDPIDPNGFNRFAAALGRVLAPDGHLFFSVPLGRQRLEFNGQRVLAARTVLAAFPKLRLADFAFIDDDGDLHEHADLAELPAGLESGCGLFEFVRDSERVRER